MLKQFMPQEGKFFDLFNAHAELIVVGGRELAALVADMTASADTRAAHAQTIDQVEKRADKITHETVSLLHKTFNTPLDRDEIHKLISRMDDILDLLQDATETMSLYDVRAMTDEVLRLGDLSARCCERVRHAVTLLPNLSQAGTAEAAIKTCEEIDRLESDADREMRNAMSKLFREETDVRELIKLKAIYEHLESISDRCEDVANLIEGVVLENS